MYHRPRMCRTCLQMSRGDFKFVSLDAGDPLWESNSPNLKEQLLTLVPEMKLDGSGTVMCTSCFIALRTGYEFKKMCQFTEQRFQNYNYKYRRPFGVGPGSAQFHVTLNETRQPNNNKNGYSGCQNINFLQADTSIDITEHHLYDASKPPPRKDFLKDPIIDQVIKTPIESLPPSKVEDKSAEVKPSDIKPIEAKPVIESKPIEIKPLIQEKPVEVKPAPQTKSIQDAIKDIKVPDIKRQQVARKKITASLHIRKKYKIGSEISILKSENRSATKVDSIPEGKNVNKLDMIIKRACDEIEYLKENYITPKSLSCYSKIAKLSKRYNLEELNKEANSYYFDSLDTEVSCQHCSTTFDTRYKLNLHEIESHPEKQLWKCTDCDQEFVNEINLRQHIDDDHSKPVIPNVEESQVPPEKIVEEHSEINTPEVEMEIPAEELHDPLIEAQSEIVEDLNDKLQENKESNIELEKDVDKDDFIEKDALLVVSKVVDDKLDESKKCRPSYEDDDEDFILEDNAFNISDSEDESIDIEINESEINQLLQDDYEGKVIKTITNKTNEMKNKEEKELSKSPFVMILPKNSVVENQKVGKILSNSVIQVEELLSKKQIEEKVNKLAEIQFVVLPSKQANTSTIKEKLLMNKELSITNLNLESKIQKEEVQKDSQKPQLEISISENVRKELSKLTVISLVKEDKTTKEISKKANDKIQKESPKPATSTLIEIDKEVSKNQIIIEKIDKLSPKKHGDAQIITNKLKESPKTKGNVQTEKNKVQKESPKKQDKTKTTPEKGNRVKESNEVQKELTKKQGKSTPEKGNKIRETSESPKKQEKGNKLKEVAEVKTEVRKESSKTQDRLDKRNKLKESAEMRTEVQQESSKKQDKPALEKEIKLKKSDEVQTDAEKRTEVQHKQTPEKEIKLKDSDEVRTDVEKHDKSTPEKGNELKESAEVNINIEKETFKKQKSTPERRNKLNESPKIKGEKSLRNQDKSSVEKGNKLKESLEVEVNTVRNESSEKQDRPTTENDNKRKESPKVKKELFKKQDQATLETVEVHSKPEIQKDSSTRPERINKLTEPAENLKTNNGKEDIPTVLKVNNEKKPLEMEAEVINESPKKQNIATTEKVNKQRELSETEDIPEESPEMEVVQEKSSQEPDMPPPGKENICEESPEIEMKQDMPTLENVNQVVNEVPKMHLNPPILQSETDLVLSQVQLNPENEVEAKMDVEPPILENEISTELFDLQLDAPEIVHKEMDVVEPKYVKPYWYKYINYIKCFICHKLCRNKLQLLQHCKFVHVPRTIPPKVVEEQEERISESEVTDGERIKVYKRDETPFKCNICDKQVLAKEYLAIHMHIHVPYSFLYDNDRIDNFICYICDKSFPKDRFMRLHNLQVHQTRNTVCKTCTRLFKSEFWYSRHKCVMPPPPAAIVEKKVEVAVEDDTQSNSYICNVCDRRFARLRFLKSHQHRMHPEAYELIYGSAGTSNSSALSDSVTEASDGVSVVDITESVSNFNDEASETSAPPRNIFDVEAKFLKSSESNFKRKSTDRMPKLQCDFCGAMISENVYDSHIYEHNKRRIEKARKSDEKPLAETPKKPLAETPKTEAPTPVTPAIVAEEAASTSETTPNPTTSSAEKPLMKCTFCFRMFQRKYHLLNHMRKHHGEQSEGLETQSANEESEVTKACDENDTSRNESMEMLECCGRQFKLKAHYARHCSTKHPDIFYKSTPSKPSSPVPLADSSAVVSTRRSNSFKPKENDNENVSNEEPPVKEKRVIKRKTLDLVETTEPVKKAKVVSESASTPDSLKRKKTSEPEGESARKKKAPPPPPPTSSSPPPAADSSDEQEGPLYKYHCTTCSRKFKQYNQLRDHNNVHTGDRPYKCYFCEPVRGFTQTSSLYVHFRRVHVAIVNNVEWEPYSKNGVCLICSGVFEKHTDMFQHAKEFYVENGFDCKVCNENFTMSCHYRVHSNNALEGERDNDTASNNSGEFSHASKNQLIRCDPCDKSFKERRDLKLHKKSLAHVQQVQTLKKQSNHKKGDESTTIEGLANSVGDILKRLSGMKKHRCSPCGITFDKRLDLKKHRREIHRRQVHRKKNKPVIAQKEDNVQEASSSTDVPFMDENDILKSITAKRRPSVLSENSDDKIDNQTDVDECDDKVDQSSQSSSQEEDDSGSVKGLYDDSIDADFDAMKLVESLQLPDEVIAEVIAEEASSEILSSQMASAVEEIAFNVGYPSVSDDFPQDIIESDGVTYTKMRGVPIDSLE